MKYLDLTLPTPEANLACDEALLDWCDAGGSEDLGAGERDLAVRARRLGARIR